MRIAIMQPGYLPWLGFFELMYNCDLFVLLDDVQYTKKDWRNRNRIRTKDGWIWLSAPVLTKNKRFQLMNEVEINNSVDWKRKHLRAIEINYHRAKYFKNYFPSLVEKYSYDWDYLVDLDIVLIGWLKDALKIITPIIRSSLLVTQGKKEEKIINICKKLNAKELYDSKAAHDILELEKFKKK
jgi:hypothetical protein